MTPRLEPAPGAANPAQATENLHAHAPTEPRRARPVDAWVGLGANLGDARATLLAAIGALGRLPGTRLRACSSRWRSAPVDATGPDFENAVARLSTTLAPHALLGHLQRIEQAHGRERPYRNAPRTLDLDLLQVDALAIDDAVLTLPHPRMHERAFVLAPLAELAPQRVLPGHGSVASLRAACAGQRITRIADADWDARVAAAIAGEEEHR